MSIAKKIIIGTACVLVVGAIVGVSVGLSKSEDKKPASPECDHVVVTDYGYAATCVKSGLTDGSHCEICDKIFVKQTVIGALGHAETVDKGIPATCIDTGLTDGAHCSRCGEILITQKDIPVTGHHFADGICPDCGKAESYDISRVSFEQSGGRVYIVMSGTYIGDYAADDFMLDCQELSGEWNKSTLAASVEVVNGAFTVKGDITDLFANRYIFHLTAKDSEKNNVMNVTEVACGAVTVGSKNYISAVEAVFGVGNGDYVTLTVQ